jgi:hypothetical protein
MKLLPVPARVLLRPSECERASDGVANQAIVQSCWPC